MALRIPRHGEVFGVVMSMLGSNKLKVRCSDERIRTCRIPGKMRKRIWIREGDAVIVKPWSIQGDERGDAIWKYTPTQAEILRRQGILKM